LNDNLNFSNPVLFGEPNLMSYSLGSSWITSTDYNSTSLLQTSVSGQPAIAGTRLGGKIGNDAALATGAGEYVIVSGTVQRDGSGGQLDPVYHITVAGSQFPSQPGGNH